MDVTQTPTDPAAALVDGQGRPARQAQDPRCPRCRANRDKRVLSAGFGEPHDVCGQCGYEWQERTL